MHHKPVVHGQFRRQLVNRQIGLSRDPRTYPILDTCQLAAPRIALRLGRKRPGLALEPHHVVDELDRNAQSPSRFSVCVSLSNKRDGALSQLNRMRFTHL